MDRTSPEVVKKLRSIGSKFSSMLSQDFTTTGEYKPVDILNAVDRGTEKFIMEELILGSGIKRRN